MFSQYDMYPHKLARLESCLGHEAQARFDRGQLESATRTFLHRVAGVKSALSVERKEEIMPFLKMLAECGWPAEYGAAIIEARDYDVKSLDQADIAFKSIGDFSQEHGMNHRHAMHIAMHYIGEALVKAAKGRFNPNQPRVPRGSSHGGEWTDGGGGGGGSGGGRTVGGGGGRFGIPKTPVPRNPLLQRVTLPPWQDDEGILEGRPGTPGGFGGPGGGRGIPGGVKTPKAPREQEYLKEARKIPEGVVESGKGGKDLTQPQAKKLEKFAKERSKPKDSVEITNYSDGRTTLSVKQPARNIPGSYAVWEKQVDAAGETITMYKVVIGPQGELIHIRTYY